MGIRSRNLFATIRGLGIGFLEFNLLKFCSQGLRPLGDNGNFEP